MDTSLSAAMGLGFLLGVRHAMDADHVAAVSTLVSQHRSLIRSCLLGAFWGAGHTVALLAAGVATIALRVTISREVESVLELTAACVLALLGGHVLLRSLAAWGLRAHEHAHRDHAGSHVHAHPSANDRHDRAHILRIGSRPLLLGLLHGMAGSAALMLLVVAAIPSPGEALLYIFVFGAGSTVGMLMLSGLMGIPAAVTAGRSPRALAIVQLLAGTTSLTLGLALLARVSA
jgi:ABC-type nickel/cobalt efflux system permease component RcnA